MQIEMLVTFKVTVEASTLNQGELKNKAKEMLKTKLPSSIHGRKCEIAGKPDKINIKVNREYLEAKTYDVKGTTRDLKAAKRT